MKIDKDSPDNLSDRDRLIYERWLKDKWSIDYKTEYCRTDHWARVIAENGIRWRVCALSKKHTKLPMVTHHRDDPRGGYPCMWEETFDDVILVCKDCHERFHDIWPESNCKGSRYMGTTLISHMRHTFDNLRPDIQDILFEELGLSNSLSYIKQIECLISECSSLDRKKRDHAHGMIDKIGAALLGLKYEIFFDDEDFVGFIRFKIRQSILNASIE